MDKDTYVYCAECIRGEGLINAIINDGEIEEKCENCYPFEPEDSRRFSERVNYEEK